MTHEDKGKFAKKHGPDARPIPAVSDAVQQRVRDGEVSCTAAFEVAAAQKVSPAQVGLAIDCLEVAIVKCQLGLFGYAPQRCIVKPVDAVPTGLEEAIRGKLVEGRLPCAAAWKLAADAEVPKMVVSKTCETLGIRISGCQLGAF